MSALLELQVWLKIALGFCLLIGAGFALFVVGIWIFAACDIVREIWRMRRR